jgi:hypothetical protein
VAPTWKYSAFEVSNGTVCGRRVGQCLPIFFGIALENIEHSILICKNNRNHNIQGVLTKVPSLLVRGHYLEIQAFTSHEN